MKTLIFDSATEDAIKICADIIKRGGLVGMPTETVYGLAANALDSEAVAGIFKAKGRPQDNPLIVHIANIDELYELAAEVPETALKLAEAFWPGPLTMILPKSDIVPREVTAGLDTVAVRMPSHSAARRLIELSGVPVAAPSANSSGLPSPTTAQHVIRDMNGKIDAILNGGDCDVGVESTVISLACKTPRILRPGGISPEDLSEVIGKVDIDPAVLSELKKDEVAASPGMKYKHYSPKAKVYIVHGNFENYKKYVESAKGENKFALCFDGEEKLLNIPALTYGHAGSSREQAHRLFNALRELDDLGADTVYARSPAMSGMGLAVYNRLLRAAAFDIIEV
ncbi:MAG: threonylcarbamoyl-AMP synthase [Clostridiales bacterium]|nr:threonylcarbamoyl-AMP synthase [Clostridiales bacterium]